MEATLRNLGGGARRGLLVLVTLMAGLFTYNDCDGTNNLIDFVRLLIMDTQEFGPNGTTRAYVFSDNEITAFYTIQTMQFQSAQFFSPPAGMNLPTSPVAVLRVAAMALDSMAANSSKLASVIELLDVKLSPDKAAIALRAQANQYRDLDDNSGAFFIVEQVNDQWSFRDRFWKQVQRQSGGMIA